MTYNHLFEHPLVTPSMTRLEALINHGDVLSEEFERVIDRLFAQIVQLNAVVNGYIGNS